MKKLTGSIYLWQNSNPMLKTILDDPANITRRVLAFPPIRALGGKIRLGGKYHRK